MLADLFGGKVNIANMVNLVNMGNMVIMGNMVNMMNMVNVECGDIVIMLNSEW
jgi:hypothetical protein